MTGHERFGFRSGDELRDKARTLKLDLPYARDIGNLFAPHPLGRRIVPNRFVIQPMEGADAGEDGAPGPLTFRRYQRYAAGGAGLIWFEAAAVVEGGRSNAHQLLISASNLPAFKRLVSETRAAAEAGGAPGPGPLFILQLTHTGRFARRGGQPAPATAQRNPFLDPLRKTDREFPLITDAELDDLRVRFAEAAETAAEAGFDGVDLKACHGYLLGELLAARARTGSRYGGSLENRARFLIEAAAEIKRRRPDLVLAVRLGACDGLAAPYGFGGSADDPERPDPAEAVHVVRELGTRGLDLLNVTLGIPAFRPYLGRPFDRPPAGGAVPPEHPLAGVARLLNAAAGLQAAFPNLPVVGTGFSWLRQHFPSVAAGAVGQGRMAFVGVGRLAFAAPDFAADLRRTGALSPRKACVTCSHCSELLHAGRPAGCVVRDRDVYRMA